MRSSREAVETAIVLLVPAALTAMFRPPLDLGLDGAFYQHLAQHVAAGEGLVTNLSLYHQALHPLPAPSTVYPVWPLVHGAAVAVLGAARAGLVFPKLLYVFDAWLVYLVIRRAITRAARESSVHFPSYVALVGAILFALDPVLFWCTSLPYSEALALALLLATLLAVDAAAHASCEARAVAFAALAGLLAALLYLTRFQAILGVPAAALALSAPARGRAAWSRPGAALAAAAIPTFAAAFRILSVPNATPRMLYDFASYRQVPELPPFEFVSNATSIVGLIMDRMPGQFIAFDPRDPDSYYASFGALTYAPLFALALAARTPRESLARIDRAVREPRYALPLAAALMGVALLIPVHLAHEVHYRPWLFGFRHGLPYALPALGAFVGLTAHPRRWVRVAAVVLGVCAAAHGGAGIATHIRSKIDETPGVLDSAAFLARHPGKTAITIDPQRLAMHSRAGIYWIACWSSPDVLPTLLEHVSVDYVLVSPSDRSCEAFARLGDRLALVEPLAGGRVLAYAISAIR